MCNSVFHTICKPEVCDIPRASCKQDLVVDNGVICSKKKCPCNQEEEIDDQDDKKRCQKCDVIN